MSFAREKKRTRRRVRTIVGAVLRLLLGLAMVCSVILPCMLSISEWGGSDWLDIAEEIRDFFGNWTSTWLFIGFMASLPLLGAYLIVAACASFRGHVGVFGFDGTEL